MSGHPPKASDGSRCTEAPGLHCGAARAHLCAHAPILNSNKPLGYRREEWLLPLSLLRVPIEVGIEEVTVSPEVLP